MLDRRRMLLAAAGSKPINTRTVAGIGRVEWDSAASYALPAVRMYGKGEQERLTGKNLFDPSKMTLGIGETVFNGKKCYKYKDSAPSPGAGFIYEANLPESVYTMTFTGYRESTSSTHYIALEFVYSDGTKESTRQAKPGDKATFTSNGKGIKRVTSLNAWGELAFLDLEIMQIERGSVPTPYEPYCGGVPAPNPNYPIEPEFLDNAKLTLSGTQLLPEQTGSFERKKTIFCALPAGTYTISTNGITSSDTDKDTCGCYIYGIGHKLLRALQAPRGVPWEFAFTVPESVESFDFYSSVNSPFSAGDTANWGNVMLNFGDMAATYEPYYTGGLADVPPIMGLLDGSTRDVFNPVSGSLENRIGFIELDGSEDEKWNVYATNAWKGFRTGKVLPSVESRAAFVSNQILSQSAGAIEGNRPSLWVGVDSYSVYYIAKKDVDLPFYDDTLPDKGLANWIAHLQASPLRIWYAVAAPTSEQYQPQPLHAHPGTNQLYQLGGFAPTEIQAEIYE